MVSGFAQHESQSVSNINHSTRGFRRALLMNAHVAASQIKKTSIAILSPLPSVRARLETLSRNEKRWNLLCTLPARWWLLLTSSYTHRQDSEISLQCYTMMLQIFRAALSSFAFLENWKRNSFIKSLSKCLSFFSSGTVIGNHSSLLFMDHRVF